MRTSHCKQATYVESANIAMDTFDIKMTFRLLSRDCSLNHVTYIQGDKIVFVHDWNSLAYEMTYTSFLLPADKKLNYAYSTQLLLVVCSHGCKMDSAQRS